MVQDVDTQEVLLRVEDQGTQDFDSIEGVISVQTSDASGVEVTATATSKPVSGTDSSPSMALDILLLRYLSGAPLIISVTDTDFNSTLPGATATYRYETLGSNDVVAFEFFGDSGNQEFFEGFPIASSGQFGPFPLGGGQAERYQAKENRCEPQVHGCHLSDGRNRFARTVWALALGY